MNLDLSLFNIKEKIRKIEFDGLQIGGDSSLSFMSENDNNSKPLLALEIPFGKDNFYPSFLQENQSDDFFKNLETAQNTEADVISIKFNTEEENLKEFIEELPKVFEKINSVIKRPLILRGANNTEVDRILIPVLSKLINKPSIIAFADEYNYEDIVPSVIENNHILVLRTPIDINLAKELNILTSDKGLSPDKILIDPDMGGLGYGLEYGYSIVERIKQAGFDGDKMLNMPIIAFIGEESYKAKEAKSDKFSEHWGDYSQRAAMWEISGASAMISAGANIIVLWNPQSIETLKELL